MFARNLIILLAIICCAVIVQAGPTSNVTEDVCEQCKHVVDNIKASGIVDKVAYYLTLVCEFSQHPEECKQQVEKWRKEFESSSETLCASIKLCDHDHQVADPHPNHDGPCTYCKELVKKLKDSGIVAQYKDQVKLLCSVCPYRNECESVINKWSSVILNNSPEQVCESVNLCEKHQFPINSQQ